MAKKEFKCPFCNKMFTNNGLSGHARFVHKKEIRVIGGRIVGTISDPEPILETDVEQIFKTDVEQIPETDIELIKEKEYDSLFSTIVTAIAFFAGIFFICKGKTGISGNPGNNDASFSETYLNDVARFKKSGNQ